jgi:cytochrome c5
MDRFLTALLVLSLAPSVGAAADPSEGKSSLDSVLNGREVYVQSCAMCHANGIGGAPRPGRAEDWVERQKNGPAKLLVSVLRGKGGMPPKGGNASLTRAEVYVALDFMLNELK